MKELLTRRNALTALLGSLGAALGLGAARKARAATQQAYAGGQAPKGYDPTKHKWLMAINIDKCIGCGLCVEACKKENKVPHGPYFRTWIERYIIKKPKPGSGELLGETVVESPNGGMDEERHTGFPPVTTPAEEILKGFYVPKLCNLCEHSPCAQACPVGATFDTPDGAVLVDPKYCIGCGFCIQACPYGCRFLNPLTKTAEKCTLCYHRITHGLKPACVEVCPAEARIFGDMLDPDANNALQDFIHKNKVGSLKPHLGTGPRVLYAGLDKEVR